MPDPTADPRPATRRHARTSGSCRGIHPIGRPPIAAARPHPRPSCPAGPRAQLPAAAPPPPTQPPRDGQFPIDPAPPTSTGAAPAVSSPEAYRTPAARPSPPSVHGRHPITLNSNGLAGSDLMAAMPLTADVTAKHDDVRSWRVAAIEGEEGGRRGERDRERGGPAGAVRRRSAAPAAHDKYFARLSWRMRARAW